MCAESGNDLAIIEGTRNNMSQYPGQRYFYDNNSTFIVDVENCVGTHMIRDPRDLVISGYFYHQWTKETGYLFHNDKWGMSYQEMVKTLPKEEGIKFEMDNKAAQTIAEMRRWNYNDPRFMEMKYVDLITDPTAEFTRMFNHWGVNPDNLQECLDIAWKNHMTIMTGRQVGQEEQGSHMRNGLPGQWKQHFTEAHKAYFKEKFGDILILLGYEKSNDW